MGKKRLQGWLIFLVLFAFTGQVWAGGATFALPHTFESGTTAVASEVNSNFSTITNNLNPAGIDDQSTNTAAMQATTDPYPGGTASLATDLAGELKRLRYMIKQITGKSQWQVDAAAFGSKGSDVASANALTLGADGNYFDITGTTAITSIGTLEVGSLVWLHFDGILTLTHQATDLILPGGANITTSAGDEAAFVEYATGDWRCVGYTKADGAAVKGIVQTVNTQTGAGQTGTTQVPDDDTIPQNTEGDEYFTVAITPTNASNKLFVEVTITLSHSGAGAQLVGALFQDSTADALACTASKKTDLDYLTTMSFNYEMTAGTTSETTFKIRAGANGAGTTTLNGVNGARKYGGVLYSGIRVTEFRQ